MDRILEIHDDESIRDARPGPAFQWYPKQILGDDIVAIMDIVAEGCHRRLIDFSWQQSPPCSLPDDEAMIKGWCKHPPNWIEVWSVVQRAWKFHNGRWWQIGIGRYYLEMMEYRLEQSQNAASGWAGKRGEERRRKRRERAAKKKQNQASQDDESEPSDGAERDPMRPHGPASKGETRNLSKSIRMEKAKGSHGTTMRSHQKSHAIASKIDALHSSSSSSSSTSTSAAASSVAVRGVENGSGPPSQDAAADAGHVDSQVLQIAHRSAVVEEHFRLESGVQSELSTVERERVRGWLASGVPESVIAETISRIAARQEVRGDPVSSWRYVARPIEDAVRNWREGRRAPERRQDLDGYREYILELCDNGIVASLHPDQVARARKMATRAKSLDALSGIASALSGALAQAAESCE